MSSPLPVAVIGAGHMGRHHVRKYAESSAVKLVAVIDTDLDRAREHAEPHGAKFATELTAEVGEIAAIGSPREALQSHGLPASPSRWRLIEV